MAPAETRRSPWEEIDQVEADRLLPIIERESLEVSAIVLSKLPTGKAAELLGKLPGDMARRIAIAISQTGSVSPMVVHRIGASIAEQLDARPVTAFDDAPVSRVGAILNYTTATVRDDVLAGIEGQDQSFADEVRAAIFTFANISERIAPRDIPRIQRDLDPDDLNIVVAGAQAQADIASVEFILSNISKRMAENIRDEAKEKGEPKTDEVEAAMIRIIAIIRELEAQGEIYFTVNEDS